MSGLNSMSAKCVLLSLTETPRKGPATPISAFVYCTGSPMADAKFQRPGPVFHT